MKPRILVVANHFPPEAVGGAEVVAHRQALALRRRGFDVTILAGARPREGFESGALRVDEVDGLTVYRLAVQSYSTESNFHWPAAAGRLQAIVAAREIDIVHFHNVTGLGANLIPAAKALGCRTIVTLHDHWGFCFKNTRLRNEGAVCINAEECGACLPAIAQASVPVPIRLRRDYVAWCLEQADLLVSPSAYLARTYEASGVIRRPVTVLSNGINNHAIPVSSPSGGEEVAFVAFAYFGEHKGIPLLIQAADRLSADPELKGRWSLTFAGHGHLEPEVVKAAADKRLHGAVRHVGRLRHHEALALMGRSDVAVLASVWPENEPVTMLEAISTGTAQLASRLGGNVELVDEDASGLMFPAGDVEALAAAMRRFILEPGLAVRFGAYNAARRDQFAEQRTIDRLQEMLTALEPAPDLEEIVVLCAGMAPDGRRSPGRAAPASHRDRRSADPAGLARVGGRRALAPGAVGVVLERRRRARRSPGFPGLALWHPHPGAGRYAQSCGRRRHGRALSITSRRHDLDRGPAGHAACGWVSHADRRGPSPARFRRGPLEFPAVGGTPRMTGRRRVLICNERFLARFGVDRILVLLAEHLAALGMEVSFACLRSDREVLARISADVEEIAVPEGLDPGAADAFVTEYLRNRWRENAPDVVITGGWPFFGAAAAADGMGLSSIFIDAGAVPHEGFPTTPCHRNWS